MKYIQQGDVIFKSIDTLPESAKLDKKFKGVVQEGEHTGHAHRLHGNDFAMFIDPESLERFLELSMPTPIRHEEHKEIILPPGRYKIGIVREYDHLKEEARAVLD